MNVVGPAARNERRDLTARLRSTCSHLFSDHAARLRRDAIN
jgi:hypothetical protein